MVHMGGCSPFKIKDFLIYTKTQMNLEGKLSSINQSQKGKYQPYDSTYSLVKFIQTGKSVSWGEGEGGGEGTASNWGRWKHSRDLGMGDGDAGWELRGCICCFPHCSDKNTVQTVTSGEKGLFGPQSEDTRHPRREGMQTEENSCLLIPAWIRIQSDKCQCSASNFFSPF